MEFNVKHIVVTQSTNQDARAGAAGDVFWADEQTNGRGRLNHKWLSIPGENLMFSVVLEREGVSPQEMVTLPLVVGLSVIQALELVLNRQGVLRLKWPNDILANGAKLCGILCESTGKTVIAGIGINVNQVDFPPEIATRATSLKGISGRSFERKRVLSNVLEMLDRNYTLWRKNGFTALWPQIIPYDDLKGRLVSVLRTDEDSQPVTGLSNGILSDGTLDIAGDSIWSGEAHVLRQES